MTTTDTKVRRMMAAYDRAREAATREGFAAGGLHRSTWSAGFRDGWREAFLSMGHDELLDENTSLHQRVIELQGIRPETIPPAREGFNWFGHLAVVAGLAAWALGMLWFAGVWR